MSSLVVITTSEDPNTAFPEHSNNNSSIISNISSSSTSSTSSGSEPPPFLDLSFGAPDGEGLVPGLPDELALRCLAHIPYMSRIRLSLVCKAWRNCFRSTAVYNARHKAGCLEEILCLSFLESSGSNSSSACLSLKLLDRQSWRWLPLATEYRHTKCKVKSFQCRAFHHKVFVFSNEDWAQLKRADWPSVGLFEGQLDVPDVVPCDGQFYSLDTASIRRFVPDRRSWEVVSMLPKRHSKSCSFRQKYFLVALQGQLGLIDVWQERWLWLRPGKVKANMSFFSLEGNTESRGVQSVGAWGPLHEPVATNGKDIAGFAVFNV